jgi:hypothetical protein
MAKVKRSWVKHIKQARFIRNPKVWQKNYEKSWVDFKVLEKGQSVMDEANKT